MKRSNFLQVVLVGLIMAVSVTGCKKTPKPVTTIPGSRIDVPEGTNPNAPKPPPTNPGGTRGTPPGGTLPPENGVVSNPVNPTPFDPNNPGALTPNDRDIIENMIADRAVLAAETIYFDFDRSNVKTTEKGKLETVAAYLKTNPTHKVQISGHCDERGTEEYNRSLGERRALSGREYLMSLGVAGDRVFTISYGEDKPADTGHDETAWSKNRRDEFVALKPKP